MKEKLSRNLHFTAGILFALGSLINFFSDDVLRGFIYLFLSVVFIMLGFTNKKNEGQ